MSDDLPLTGGSGKPPASARGLFAATGKVAKRAIERVPHDFYRTPPEVTRAFVREEYERLRRYKIIWEPAAGDGAMADVLVASGFNVVCSDIADRGCRGVIVRDFFECAAPADAIITNPPFSKTSWKDGRGRWITHALDILHVDYMALLLPWTWPAAQGLRKVWKEHPPSLVYLLTWRIDWTEQGAPPSYHAWFVWDRGHRGETILRRLEKLPKQGDLFK